MAALPNCTQQQSSKACISLPGSDEAAPGADMHAGYELAKNAMAQQDERSAQGAARQQAASS